MEYFQPINWPSFFFHLVIFLSLFCSKMDAKTRMSNETDKLALLQFKAKITDDPFGIMRFWNDSTIVCQWYGVTCSTRHKRVTKLNLGSLKLGGSISPHIGNLSFLQVLRLQNNSLIRRIPPEIGRLRRLQVLSLLNNTLGGEIPLNLSSCLELRLLSLSNNKLEGQIPLQLGSLTKLESFGAAENNLTGALPSSLGNLTSLEKLSFAFNNLVGRIPVTIGSLIHLSFLSLSYNYLSGEVPPLVFNLSRMEAFDFGGNQLEGHLPPELFHTLPNLQVLYVGTNQFTGPIPVSLSNASNLQSLQFLENNLTGKVPSLEKLNKLSNFNVGGNQLGSGARGIDGLSFICTLANDTALRILELGKNSFGGMLPGCIANLSSQLIYLGIASNHISGSIPPNIDNLVGLETLILDYNSFTGSIPPTIGNLENLLYLSLTGNDYNSFTGSIPSSLGKLSKLYHLDLSSNTLEGTIPSSLHNCTFLQLLNLDQNKLTGPIPPQVLTIPSLSLGFYVSQNRLTGPLPEEVGKLRSLNSLDVSSNMLSSEIPDSLGDCTSLEVLYLDGNNFQGHIPSSLSSMRGLRALDISANNLSGQIPQFLASFTDLIMLNLSFNELEGAVPKEGVFANTSSTLLEGNNKLCGGVLDFHLPECISFPQRKKGRLPIKTKVTIATIVGVSGVALLIVLLLVFGLRRKRRQSQEELASPSAKKALQFVSYGDLHRATNGFSDGSLVGTGSFGYVYKGIIGEGGHTAIKVLNLKHVGANRSFVAECEALRNIRHRSLVKLLTVCSGVDYQGNEFKALVYEFMPNGSLEDWLHPVARPEDEILHDQMPPRKLGLLMRLSIAIDVASLLEYLHYQFGTPLVHCDIKPSNILLDGDLSGRVSDFGLARFLSDTGIIRSSIHLSSSTGVRGTVGYAPPEYGVGSKVSTKGDVYSYGILLLEMFTGKRPTDEMFKEGLSLHLYAKMSLPSGVLDIFDPIIQDLLETEDQVLNPRRSARVMDCLVSIIEVGVACSHASAAERMDMSMVTTKLSKIRDNLSQGRN